MRHDYSFPPITACYLLRHACADLSHHSRRSTAKPTEDFYMNFKQKYSNFATTAYQGPVTPAHTQASTSNGDNHSMSHDL